MKIPDGIYYSVRCQSKAEKKDILTDSGELVYARDIRLNVDDIDFLNSVIPPIGNDFEYKKSYVLSERQVVLLKPFFDEEVDICFDKYQYSLEQCWEEWRHEVFNAEKDQKIPSPKYVFALSVYEKGEKYPFGVMPLWDIDIEEVRVRFNKPEPDNFETMEDRVDDDMYDFIRDRIRCNNINLSEYEYEPGIWTNVFTQQNYTDEDMVIIPSNGDNPPRTVNGKICEPLKMQVERRCNKLDTE